MKLPDKVSIVTGGGRGIGRAICHAFAREGAHVVAADIDLASAQQVASEIKKLGAESMALKADVSNSLEVQEMVRRAVERFSKIDILVNNAGIYVFCTVEECSEEYWDKIMDVNLKGVFLCSQAAMRYMKEARSGRIINIASAAGKTGGARAGAPYSASKAGVICFTKSLANELAPFGINVNAIAPGVIETDMTRDYPDMSHLIPLRRVGRPEDVANCAVFLASEDADYLTGEIIDVNGGMVMD